MNHRIRLVITCSVMAAAGFVVLAGCTPEQDQAIRDAVNSAAQDAAKQAVDFALSFGRQALAAFLF